MQTVAGQAALFTETKRSTPVHAVGIGDAGCRAASEIWRRRIPGVAVTCVDSDALSLERSQADNTVLLGAATLHGFGSGGDIDAVAAATRAQAGAICKLAEEAVTAVVIAGLTGGTGTGAVPLIAGALSSTGTQVICLPIMPLEFEPIDRHLAAGDAVKRLREVCDGVLEISRAAQGPVNDTSGTGGVALRQVFSADRNFAAAFVRTASSIVNADPVRCDANSGDLQAVLHDGASAVFGTANGFGHTGAAEATHACLENALQGTGNPDAMERALVLVESGPDISVSHVATITSLIETRIGSEVELHPAVRRSRLLGGNVQVSVIGAMREQKRPVTVEPVRTRHPRQSDQFVNTLRTLHRSAVLN